MKRKLCLYEHLINDPKDNTPKDARPEGETGLFARLPLLGLACWGPTLTRALAKQNGADVVVIDNQVCRAWAAALQN